MTENTHDQDRTGTNNESPDKRQHANGPANDEIEETGRAHQPTNPVLEAQARVRLQAQEEDWRKGAGKPDPDHRA